MLIPQLDNTLARSLMSPEPLWTDRSEQIHYLDPLPRQSLDNRGRAPPSPPPENSRAQSDQWWEHNLGWVLPLNPVALPCPWDWGLNQVDLSDVSADCLCSLQLFSAALSTEMCIYSSISPFIIWLNQRHVMRISRIFFLTTKWILEGKRLLQTLAPSWQSQEHLRESKWKVPVF